MFDEVHNLLLFFRRHLLAVQVRIQLADVPGSLLLNRVVDTQGFLERGVVFQSFQDVVAADDGFQAFFGVVAFEGGKRWLFGRLMIFLMLLSLSEDGSDIRAAVMVEYAALVVLLVVVQFLGRFGDIFVHQRCELLLIVSQLGSIEVVILKIRREGHSHFLAQDGSALDLADPGMEDDLFYADIRPQSVLLILLQ